MNKVLDLERDSVVKKVDDRSGLNYRSRNHEYPSTFLYLCDIASGHRLQKKTISGLNVVICEWSVVCSKLNVLYIDKCNGSSTRQHFVISLLLLNCSLFEERIEIEFLAHRMQFIF